MDDEVRGKATGATSEARRQFMCKLGEKYPWLHPDYDPDSLLWRERAVRAWNALGRRQRLY